MKSTPKTHSYHASIQDIIINEDRKKLRKNQVNHLFISPNLSEIDTNEFNRHPFMFKNQLFTFFVHQLEKWNKKIRNKEITPFYHAQLKKYTFIHSSLKIISLRKPNQIDQYLQQLSLWYSKNSYNIPQPSVLMKKYDLSEQWEVRKTFKSNTPSQINNYRRRFFCSPDDKESCLKTLGITIKKDDCFFNDTSNQKLKNSLSTGYMATFKDDRILKSQAFQPFQEIDQNNEKKLLKKQNMQVRNNREQNEIKQAQNQWKASHGRFGQKSCKNFYQGKFKTNKYFSQSTARIEPRKIFTAPYNIRNSQQVELMNTIKKRRLQTSLGFRGNLTNQQQNLSYTNEKSNENLNILSKEENKQTVQSWLDNFLVDEDKINIGNTFDRTGTGMKLMSNPFQNTKTKIKKKKK